MGTLIPVARGEVQHFINMLTNPVRHEEARTAS
jgi:hypothetical protein